jgi:hypothetical protein
MVKLEGWCLPSLDAASLSGPAQHFFLNLHRALSARQATFGELAGYVLVDNIGQGYFIVMSEAEMSMLFQMAQ